MTQQVAYLYGNGGFTLNASQVAELTILRDAANSNADTLGAGVVIYPYLLSLITVTYSPPTTLPAAGVDPNVVAWLQGASGVNTARPGDNRGSSPDCSQTRRT